MGRAFVAPLESSPRSFRPNRSACRSTAASSTSAPRTTASFTSLFEKDEQPSPAAKKTSERTDILLSTSAALDHNDEILHAEEVDNGVHILLFLSLQEAVAESYDSEDVVLSLDSLVKILRCTDDKARKIFVGGDGVSLLGLILGLEMLVLSPSVNPSFVGLHRSKLILLACTIVLSC